MFIFPEMGCCKIKNDYVHFENHSTNKNIRKVEEIFQDTINFINSKKPTPDKILEVSNLTKFLSVPPFVPKNHSKDGPNDSKIVKLAQKLTYNLAKHYILRLSSK